MFTMQADLERELASAAELSRLWSHRSGKRKASASTPSHSAAANDSDSDAEPTDSSEQGVEDASLKRVSGFPKLCLLPFPQLTI